MQPLLYGELTPWYRLLDPVADHADEAAAYADAFERGGTPPGGTLLELGAGAGGNASFIKSRFRCTLTDISPEMSDVRAVHDHHVEGLFARATWIEVLTAAGYRVELVDRPFDDTSTDSIFLCRRP